MSTTITRADPTDSELAAPSPPLHSPTRNRYFYGKLLDDHHLTLEQHYLVHQRRLLNRLGLGFGILCGLGVTPAINGTSVIIHPGVAIDALGREIIVPEPLCLDPAAIKEDDPGDGSVTLCLCYHECEIEPVPALVSDCTAHEQCVNGLIRERFSVHAHPGIPREPAYPGVTRMVVYLLERIALFERGLAAADAGGDVAAGDPADAPPKLDHLEIARAVAALPGMAAPVVNGPAATPLGDDPTVTELVACCAPSDDCVVLATVTPAADANSEMTIDGLTYTRRIMSNDALQEMLIGLGYVVERCCRSVKGNQTIDVSGDKQVGPASSRLPEAIVATVKDADGNPVSGAELTFAVRSGGGSFAPKSTKTKATGRASARWTLGDGGEQTAVISVADGPSRTVTASIKTGD